MKIQQYYLACLSHASYMITDEKTKTAAVVDPQRDVDRYLADMLYDSITSKLVMLPDATLVYPAHGEAAGCRRGVGGPAMRRFRRDAA